MDQRQLSQNLKNDYEKSLQSQLTGIKDIDILILKKLDINSLQKLYLTDRYTANLLDDNELLRILSYQFFLYPSDSFYELINEYKIKHILINRKVRWSDDENSRHGKHIYYEMTSKKIVANKRQQLKDFLLNLIHDDELIALILLAQYGFGDIVLAKIQSNPLILLDSKYWYRVFGLELVEKAVYGGNLELMNKIFELSNETIETHPQYLNLRGYFNYSDFCTITRSNILLASIEGDQYEIIKYLMNEYPSNYIWTGFYYKLISKDRKISRSQMLNVFAIATDLGLTDLINTFIEQFI